MSDRKDQEEKEYFQSGRWVGFFAEGNQRGHGVSMELRLRFREGQVEGRGVDAIGEFRIQGTYETADGTCKMTKTYDGGWDVCYTGRLGDQGVVRGQWTLSELMGDRSGRFQIWPEGSLAEDAPDDGCAAVDRSAGKRDPDPVPATPPRPVASGGITLRLPKFIWTRARSGIQCGRCHGRVTQNSLEGFGLEYDPPGANPPIAFIEFRCPNCDHRTRRRVGRFSLQAYARMLLDLIDAELTQKVAPSIRPNTPAEPISDAEVDKIRRSLNKIAFRPGAYSWKKFLRNLEYRDWQADEEPPATT